MKAHSAVAIAIALMLAHGAAEAQERDRPSLLVAPWAGPPNMAAEVARQVVSGIDSLGHFDRISWDDLVSSSRVTRDMSESRRAAMGCVQGRQLAGVEGVEYVFCGALVTTPEGIRIELELWDLEASRRIAFSSLVDEDREALVEHALSQIRGWNP